MTKMDSKRMLWAVLPVVALLVGAPVPANAEATSAEATASKAPSEVEALRERATKYWDARIAQSTQSLDFYEKDSSGQPPRDVPDFGSVRYPSYQIEKVEVDGDEGFVLVTVPPAELKLPVTGLPEIKRRPQIREAWVKVEGTWYKKPVDRSLSRIFTGKMRRLEQAAESQSQGQK
jgi:hypothetical protein